MESMTNWPVPKNVKELRGFLGLTGYYRRFLKGYGVIAKPLTELLKKDAFKWSLEAQNSFEELKRAMTSTPVLALPDFSKSFVVEIDACQMGIGAVLMQGRNPISYFSKKLGPKNQHLSTYEKELLALYTAVSKWRHYLLGGSFVIKTDQSSLKFLLEQRLNTPMQHKGLSKLLGLNYTVEYKRGVENKAADALSRREGQNGKDLLKEANVMVLSELIPQWMHEVHNSYINDNWITSLKKKLESAKGEGNKHHLSLH